MDQSDLTTDFGPVNFEDFGLVVSTTESNQEIPEVTTHMSETDFDMEMKKVTSMLRQNGFDIPEDQARQMLDELMLKAKKVSQDEEERREKVEMVDSLVRMFMRSNAERAKKRFKQRKNKNNPVKELNEDLAEQFMNNFKQQQLEETTTFRPEVTTMNINDYEEYDDYGQDYETQSFLVDKIKGHDGPRDQFGQLLNAPQPIEGEHQFLIQKVQSHSGPKDQFGEVLNAPDNEEDTFLFQKIQSHSGPRVKFGPHLKPPQKQRDQILIQKIKSHSGQRKPIDQVLDPLPNIENSLPKPQIVTKPKGEIPSIPRSTTPANIPKTTTEKFKEMLRETENKNEMEDEIMGMIIEDPDTVIETFSGMFEHGNEKEQVETKQELSHMIEKDPLGVTVAFTDLMLKQNELMKVNPDVEEEVEHTTMPHKYEDPPKEVQGQLLRLWNKNEGQVSLPVRVQVSHLFYGFWNFMFYDFFILE